MGTVRQGDLGVAPLYLMRGRDPKQQMAILHFWNMSLSGQRMTLKSLTEAAGTAITTKTLDDLVDAGVLRVEEGEGDGKTRLADYVFSADFITERPADEQEGGKQADRLPAWVFDACNRWKAAQGLVGPRIMHNALKAAVAIYGAEAVADALERYAKATPAKFNPSPFRFVEHIAQYIRKRDETPTARSFKDVIRTQEAADMVDF